MTAPDPAAVVRAFLAARRWGARQLEQWDWDSTRTALKNMAFWTGHDEGVTQQAADHLVRLATRCGWPAAEAYRWIFEHMKRGAYIALLEAWLADPEVDAKVTRAR